MKNTHNAAGRHPKTGAGQRRLHRAPSPEMLDSPPRTVTVQPRKESLDFKYTSLNLAAPEKGRFKYRLAGHEKDWQPAPWNASWCRRC